MFTPHFKPEVSCVGVSSLPFAMTHAQSVVIDDMIFVGGGLTNRDDGVNNVLFKYSPKSDTWIILSGCPVIYYGLGTINGRPVVVGGKDISIGGKVTGNCYIFEAETEEWKKSVPVMKIPRYDLTVASYGDYLVACGGKDYNNRFTQHVEVYSIKRSRWYIATDLPRITGSYLSNTIIDGYLYVGTGQHVAYTSLVNIKLTGTTPIATSANKGRTSNKLLKPMDLVEINLNWTLLSNNPVNNGSLMRVGHLLCCVGGQKLQKERYNNFGACIVSSISKHTSPWVGNTSIYFYQPLANNWTKLVPNCLSQCIPYCCTASLSDNILYVMGGDLGLQCQENQLDTKARKEVFQIKFTS